MLPDPVRERRAMILAPLRPSHRGAGCYAGSEEEAGTEVAGTRNMCDRDLSLVTRPTAR